MNPKVLVAVWGSATADPQIVAGRLEQAGRSVWLPGAAGAEPAGERLRAAGREAEQRGCSQVVTLELDLGDDPERIDQLLTGGDPDRIVVGRRRPEPAAPGWFWAGFCLRLASGVPAVAARSSFRVYPTEVLTRGDWRGRGRVAALELLVRAVWAGVRVEVVDLDAGREPEQPSVLPVPPVPPGWRALPVYARLCLRNLNPWPHRRQFGTDPDAVSFSFRRPGAWWWSVHLRATRRLGADEAGLSLRHPIRSLRNLHLERTEPLEISLACALGVFLGALPLLFTHTIAIVFYATRLRLNRAIAFYASNLCAPFVPPFVPALDIELGHYLLHGRFLTLADLGSGDALFQTLCAEAHLRLLEYLVGSLLVGPALALLVGGIVYALASTRGRNSTGEVTHG